MRIQLQRRDEISPGCGNACRIRRITPTPHRRHPSCRRPDHVLVGEWPNRDPIGDRPRRSYSKRWLREQANLYHFTFNDPVNRQDVLGLAVNDVHVVTLPIDKLNCPSTCGPDYTASVNSEIARLRGHLAGLPAFPAHDEIMDAEAAGMIATYNLSGFYLWFARLALSLNYDWQAKNAVKGVPLSGCPTAKCLGTFTLCGKCVTSDAAGNVMFGFAAAGAGIGDSMRNFGAHVAELDIDGEFPEQDTDVFPLGKDLFNSGSNDICSVLNKLPNHGKRGDCSPCSTAGSFTPASFPAYPRYQ